MPRLRCRNWEGHPFGRRPHNSHSASNQFPKLPGYAVFNLRASYQINKTFQIYGRINNVFDNLRGRPEMADDWPKR
jgi:outer membrane cobalamin receptor